MPAKKSTRGKLKPPTPLVPDSERPETKCLLCRCRIKFRLVKSGPIHVWRNGEREPCRDPKSRKNFELEKK